MVKLRTLYNIMVSLGILVCNSQSKLSENLTH